MPHINKLYDFVIVAIIAHKDKVLLVHHPRYGQWIPMGGHIELDEDPDQALMREIKEETGLEVEILSQKPNINSKDIKILYPPRYLEVHSANPPHKHIALVYYARAKNDRYVLSDEHNDIAWLTIEDLDDPRYALSNSVKYYCKEAINLAKETYW